MGDLRKVIVATHAADRSAHCLLHGTQDSGDNIDPLHWPFIVSPSRKLMDLFPYTLEIPTVDWFGASTIQYRPSNAPCTLAYEFSPSKLAASDGVLGKHTNRSCKPVGVVPKHFAVLCSAGGHGHSASPTKAAWCGFSACHFPTTLETRAATSWVDALFERQGTWLFFVNLK